MRVVINNIEYDQANELYFLNAELELQTYTGTAKKMNKKVDQINQVLYRGSRRFDDHHFLLEIFLGANKEIGLLITNEQEVTMSSTIKVKYNTMLLLSVVKEAELPKILPRVINECLIFVHETLGFTVDEKKLAHMLRDEILSRRKWALIKLQNSFRRHLALKLLKLTMSKWSKDMSLLGTFVVKMGKQYHFIKILKMKNDLEKIVIRSDKAANEVTTLISTIIPPKHNGALTSLEIKELLKNLLAFNPTKRRLVLMPRKINTTSPSK